MIKQNNKSGTPLRILVCIAVVLSSLCAAAAVGAEKKDTPQPRLYFNDDTTHIGSCISPYHPKGRGHPLSDSMFRGPVDEAADAGVDVYLLQPGTGWVPWWPSKVLPFEVQDRWFKAHYGHQGRGAFISYVAKGNDFIKTMEEQTHKRGMRFYLSFRLNDAHHLHQANNVKTVQLSYLCQLYVEHPEYRIGRAPGQSSVFMEWIQNWAFKEVRDYKFNQIVELCENYRIDGLELDFMRHAAFFNTGKTTAAKRRDIMTEFVRKVRKTLDRTAGAGAHRVLMVKIPLHLECHDSLGVDMKTLRSAGVDVFNLASFNATEQMTEIAQMRRLVPDAGLTLQMTYISSTIRDHKEKRWIRRRTTPEQFFTGAHLAYSRGADAVSLFNFQYYRPIVHDNEGPFSEPPFNIIKILKDPKLVARQPQHYILATLEDDHPLYRKRELPVDLSKGKSALFSLDMAPPSGGWAKKGKLRIQASKALDPRGAWTATLNGTKLKSTQDVSEPYPNPYTQALGAPNQLRAWVVPASILKDGFNKLEIRQTTGSPSRIFFVDLSINSTAPDTDKQTQNERKRLK